LPCGRKEREGQGIGGRREHRKLWEEEVVLGIPKT